MSTTSAPTPTLRDYPAETICPSCGKFVGAYTRCPYCGCEHKHRISIRFFRIFSIVISLGGIFLIWLAARGINAPLIKIKEISPLQSFAYVRIEGEVTRTSTYSDGGVSFVVEDTTGSLQVRAYADTGKMLLKENRVPSAGDRVSVEGTINFREDRGASMIVNVPEKVTIERVVPAAVRIADIGEKVIGRKALIEGRIIATRTFPKGSSVTVSDGTGTIEVVVWDSSRALFGEKEKLLAEGRSVSVQGKVGKYKDTLQIVLDFPGDIKEREHALEAPGAKPGPGANAGVGFQKTDIGDLNRGKTDQPVEITGKVTGLRRSSKGTALELADPTGSVDVFVWDTLRDRMPRASEVMAVGTMLKVRGVVGEYRDKLQVVPRSADQVEEAARPE